MEIALGLLAPAVALVDEAEVRDHVALVLVVPELAQDDERLLEVLNRRVDPVGVDDGEREVVQRQSLGALVAEVANDRERGAVLRGGALVLPFPAELCPERVELVRLVRGIGQ